MNFTSLKSFMLAALLLVAGQVMAQTVVLSEDFSKCTSSNPDNPGDKMDGKTDEYTQISGWSCTNGFIGEGNMKFATSSKAGSIVTPAIDLSDETATYTLKFKACAWYNDAVRVLVQVDEQEAVEVTGLTNTGAPYAACLKEFSLEVKGTSQSKIKIQSASASKGRFFLDDIEVSKLAAGEVADASLSCPKTVIFGSVGVGVQAVEKVEMSGQNLTGDLSVVVEGEGFSCATTTIAKDDAAKAELEVLFVSSKAGDYSGVLTISGGGLKESAVIALSANVVQLEGEGTIDSPYTIADVFTLNNPGRTAWVTGYIVGRVENGNIKEGSTFNADGESVNNSNVLIAASAMETDYNNCVAVQLPAGDVRNVVNLSDNPANLGKQVNLLGEMVAYFGVCGLKNATEYKLNGVSVADVVADAAKVPVKVYTLGGVEVGDSLDGLQKGIYIVKQGDKVKKVVK